MTEYEDYKPVSKEEYEEALESKVAQLEELYKKTFQGYLLYIKDRDCGKYYINYFKKDSYLIYTKTKKQWGFKPK